MSNRLGRKSSAPPLQKELRRYKPCHLSRASRDRSRLALRLFLLLPLLFSFLKSRWFSRNMELKLAD